MAKLPFIALVDDRSDWFIFKELCKIKIGESDSKILDNVSVIKCFSGHSTKDERFGIAKIQKVKGLYEICRDAKKNCTIFMICDKDNYPITNISQRQGNLEVKGADLHYMEKELGQRTQHKATLLSWKRREIENYLLSETMLTKYGRLDEVKELIAAKYHVNLSNGNNEGLTEPDVKSIVKSLYLKDAHSESDDNEKGTDYEKLKKVISEIPATEISYDIVAMFNFIKGKMQASR